MRGYPFHSRRSYQRPRQRYIHVLARAGSDGGLSGALERPRSRRLSLRGRVFDKGLRTTRDGPPPICRRVCGRKKFGALAAGSAVLRSGGGAERELRLTEGAAEVHPTSLNLDRSARWRCRIDGHPAYRIRGGRRAGASPAATTARRRLLAPVRPRRGAAPTLNKRACLRNHL